MEQLHKARQYRHGEDDALICSLCNHRCTIREGKHGICGVRENRNGILYAMTYGKVSSEAVDPIEKKPLYHFLPGTLSYSLGSVGCNFRCEHCQNWQISRADITGFSLRDISPEEGVKRAEARMCASISWTYNEPTIWHEYALDMGTLAKGRGLATVYVTNGYITEEALREISPVLDAFRVDIKAFTEDFYKKICGAKLQPVLDSAVLARELGMHIEVVNLVIPGLNDSAEETGALIGWIAENLGPDTPVHFTRFHPDYRMRDREATPVATLERIYRQAKEGGLHYPYVGNVFMHRYESTYCPVCSALIIERRGFSAITRNLAEGRCTSCGAAIAIVDHV
ncbi:MAG: AmmeMemoRadiSam system radical SAM enzyme [Methanomicrobiales archaeon]|nr:AmmeMemoRadiSam system radical SAM enzyme [Methanomicrobiales archaeon]NYT20831.1 AmmeMemoRadiSam system radical SAM enzyme [Methanomicrobiales archaeon]